MRARLGKTLAVLIPVALLGWLGWHLLASTAPPPLPPQPQPLPRVAFQPCETGCHYAGAALPGMNLRELEAFTAAAGAQPGIVEGYQAFRHPFPLAWAHLLLARKILPLIQINPRRASLTAIASGHYDSYLSAYGHQVASLGAYRVALSFGPEQNGTWYSWGCRHVSAKTYVAAYRRVVTIIQRAGARNVIWVWTAHAIPPGPHCPMSDRYPGGRYVTWVGVNGYLRIPGATFAHAFAMSLAQIHRFSGKPILLTEVGAATGPQQAQRITALYKGAATAPGCLGLLYFDTAGNQGNYRPQGNPAALAAFRRGVTSLLHAH